MGVSLKKKTKALEILKDYDGNNSYISLVKRDVIMNNTVLSDFQVEYILNNHDFEPIILNKIVKISKWYGEKKQNDWGIEFIPEKLLITSIIGETDTTYNCYVVYRRSQAAPKMCFIPKKAILDPLFITDYNDLDIDFDKYDKLTLRHKRALKDHQKIAIKFLVSREKCILADDMGLGKAQHVDTKIPTPTGWKRMGDLKIGDKIFGSDGKSHNVIGVFPQGKKNIYEITFSDGVKTNCCDDHLWIVRDQNRRRRGKGWIVKSLRELLDNGIHHKQTKFDIEHNKFRNKWEIPMCKPVEYDEKEFIIHPYILGMCIGDGNLCSGGIHISIPDFEIESTSNIEELLHEDYTLSCNRSSACPSYSIIRKKELGYGKNIYNQEIKRLGLNVHGNDKFIPYDYLTCSVKQRLELLRGLLDSDGSISKGNKISFSSNSLRLINDVTLLVQSLGGRTKFRCYNREKDGKKIEYSLSIQLRINPFKLKRKSDLYCITENNKKYCTRYIQDVKLIKNAEAICIKVDSSDESYLTEHYIVTHNTMSAIVASIEGGFEKVLVICPASVKTTWRGN